MQLSGALGRAVLGSLSSDRTAALNPWRIGGFRLSFTVAAVCVGIGPLAAQLLPRPLRATPRERQSQQSAGCVAVRDCN
jgi:hypothetical protein